MAKNNENNSKRTLIIIFGLILVILNGYLFTANLNDSLGYYSNEAQDIKYEYDCNEFKDKYKCTMIAWYKVNDKSQTCYIDNLISETNNLDNSKIYYNSNKNNLCYTSKVRYDSICNIFLVPIFIGLLMVIIPSRKRG